MKALKGKALLLTTSLAILGYALPAIAEQKKLEDLPVIMPQSTLVYCDLVVPNGYVWSGVITQASCGNVGHPMIAYVLESYFDKAVGTTLRICSPNFVPQGWYIINEVPGQYCTTGGPSSAREWIIQRYQ